MVVGAFSQVGISEVKAQCLKVVIDGASEGDKFVEGLRLITFVEFSFTFNF